MCAFRLILEGGQICLCDAVRNRTRMIHMFLGLTDPDLDLLVRGTDPDPSIIKQK
jgi:hypothetical protein